MSNRELSTFAGWLLFNGERVADISHLPAGKRMMFEETIAAITWPETEWGERFKALFVGRLWLRQMNFGQSLQPQCPTFDTPFGGSASQGERR